MESLNLPTGSQKTHQRRGFIQKLSAILVGFFSTFGSASAASRETNTVWEEMSQEQRKKLKFRILSQKNRPKISAEVKINFKRFRQLSQPEKEKFVANADRWIKLDKKERRRFEKRLNVFRNLARDKQDDLKRKHGLWQNLSEDEKNRLRKELI